MLYTKTMRMYFHLNIPVALIYYSWHFGCNEYITKVEFDMLWVLVKKKYISLTLQSLCKVLTKYDMTYWYRYEKLKWNYTHLTQQYHSHLRVQALFQTMEWWSHIES